MVALKRFCQIFLIKLHRDGKDDLNTPDLILEQLREMASLGYSNFTFPCYQLLVHSPQASQVVLMVKNLSANAGDIRDAGWISGWGRFPGQGRGNPLQYCCLENPQGQRSLVGYSP